MRFEKIVMIGWDEKFYESNEALVFPKFQNYKDEVKLHRVKSSNIEIECSIFIIIIRRNSGKPHEQIIAPITKL